LKKTLSLSGIFIEVVCFLFLFKAPAIAEIDNSISHSSSATITVPDDFVTLQEAIDNATSGDTIFVKSGTYYERFTINKPVNIQGQNKETTIIDGLHSGDIITVNTGDVSLVGLTIRNALNCYGIYLNSANNGFIKDCIIKNCKVGAAADNLTGAKFDNVEFCRIDNQNRAKGLKNYEYEMLVCDWISPDYFVKHRLYNQ
jgi:nitrous oxidase accessory protein NosD